MCDEWRGVAEMKCNLSSLDAAELHMELKEGKRVMLWLYQFKNTLFFSFRKKTLIYKQPVIYPSLIANMNKLICSIFPIKQKQQEKVGA